VGCFLAPACAAAEGVGFSGPDHARTMAAGVVWATLMRLQHPAEANAAAVEADVGCV
jgi:hypothetical protein